MRHSPFNGFLKRNGCFQPDLLDWQRNLQIRRRSSAPLRPSPRRNGNENGCLTSSPHCPITLQSHCMCTCGGYIQGLEWHKIVVVALFEDLLHLRPHIHRHRLSLTPSSKFVYSPVDFVLSCEFLSLYFSCSSV